MCLFCARLRNAAACSEHWRYSRRRQSIAMRAICSGCRRSTRCGWRQMAGTINKSAWVSSLSGVVASESPLWIMSEPPNWLKQSVLSRCRPARPSAWAAPVRISRGNVSDEASMSSWVSAAMRKSDPVCGVKVILYGVIRIEISAVEGKLPCFRGFAMNPLPPARWRTDAQTARHGCRRWY